MEEPPPQEEEDLGPPWEAWVLDFEVVPEGRRGVSEESGCSSICSPVDGSLRAVFAC